MRLISTSNFSDTNNKLGTPQETDTSQSSVPKTDEELPTDGRD